MVTKGEDVYHNNNLLALGCYLCEGESRPAVASCRRCGALVCRDHSSKLVHPGRTETGPMGVGGRTVTRRLEIVCEACSLLEVEDVETEREEKVEWGTR